MMQPGHCISPKLRVCDMIYVSLFTAVNATTSIHYIHCRGLLCTCLLGRGCLQLLCNQLALQRQTPENTPAISSPVGSMTCTSSVQNNNFIYEKTPALKGWAGHTALLCAVHIWQGLQIYNVVHHSVKEVSPSLNISFIGSGTLPKRDILVPGPRYPGAAYFLLGI